MTLLKKSDDHGIIALAVLVGVVVAPVVEEFLFRLVLQGALERAELLAATQESAKAEPSPAARGGPAESGAVAPAEVAGVRPRLEELDGSPAGPPNSRVWGLPLGVWPMTISSTLFALMHARGDPTRFRCCC